MHHKLYYSLLIKYYVVLAITVLLGNIVWASETPIGSKSVEVPLQQVFVPETGYGTNNNIQMTLDGFLPNSCFQIGKAKIESGEEPNTIVIHQYADQETEGVCADFKSLPVHLANIVPFTYDVNLGHLAAGEYKVLYSQNSNQPKVRKFQVYASKNLTADDFPYAAVSTISMPDLVSSKDPLVFEFSGTLTSSCSYISDTTVTVQNDVIVIQPVLGHRRDRVCIEVLVPFTKKVTLGGFFEGRYLLGIRSMSGKAVNHVFSVVPVK